MTMIESADTLQGHVLGVVIRAISCDSAHINRIGGRMMLYKLSRILEPQFRMGLLIVAEEVEEV